MNIIKILINLIENKRRSYKKYVIKKWNIYKVLIYTLIINATKRTIKNKLYLFFIWREHQIECINNINKYFENDTKALVKMFCGSG
jgi:superfamily II DNA or RNA helicase